MKATLQKQCKMKHEFENFCTYCVLEEHMPVKGHTRVRGTEGAALMYFE